LIEQAVDEALRWRATDPVFPRVSTRDYEVEGILIPAGSRVWMCLGAANHDPAVFERPGEFDIFRPKANHMGLGFGPHRCLGMDVARQEMVVAINGLMDRFPDLRIDPDLPRPEYRGLDHRGMSSLNVRLRGA
jgi:cytochrome P450